MNLQYELKKICRRAKDEILQYLEDNWEYLDVGGIDTPLRKAHFMAQLAHESDGFRTTREYASGRAYEGRTDLGNVHAGDGVKYRGRGLIQVTGRYNYRFYGHLLGVDLENRPELAEEFPAALQVPILYWVKNNLNKYADKDDIRIITRKINGGYNGLRDRQKYLLDFKKLFGV